MPPIARNSGEDIGVLVGLQTAMENTHEIMTDERSCFVAEGSRRVA